MLNQVENPFLNVTAAGQGLGDLPIGSLESRVRARSLLAARAQIEEQQQESRFCVMHDIYGNEINLQAMALEEEQQKKEDEARRRTSGGERGD